jgi:hypothetical protein
MAITDPLEVVILSIIVGTLAAIVYSLRVLVILERRIARMDLNVERIARKIAVEEMRIEEEEAKILAEQRMIESKLGIKPKTGKKKK